MLKLAASSQATHTDQYKSDFLNMAMATFHQRLRATPMRALIQNLQNMVSNGPVTVGTVCSGTDMPTYVFRRMRDLWMCLFGGAPTFQHIFSCECNPMAQGFIKRHHCPRMLFADIAELGGDVAFDVLSQSKQPVTSVHIMVGGARSATTTLALTFSPRLEPKGSLRKVRGSRETPSNLSAGTSSDIDHVW